MPALGFLLSLNVGCHPGNIYLITSGQGPVALLKVVWGGVAGILSTPTPAAQPWIWILGGWHAPASLRRQRIEWWNQLWNAGKCLWLGPWATQRRLGNPLLCQFNLNRVDDLAMKISTQTGLYHKGWEWYLLSNQFLIENTDSIAHKSAQAMLNRMRKRNSFQRPLCTSDSIVYIQATGRLMKKNSCLFIKTGPNVRAAISHHLISL